MQKPAPVEAPIQALLQNRWSARALDSRPVERAELHSLLEAARWAASSGNEQPWRFVVATREDPEGLARLASCLTGSNPAWAANAPVLILTVAHAIFAKSGKANRYAWHDCGQALANLMLEATARGLVAHPMAGFDAAKAREVLEIPADFEPVALVAVAYPGDPAQLSEEQRQREIAPRVRLPFAELVFEGTWGRPAALVSR